MHPQSGAFRHFASLPLKRGHQAEIVQHRRPQKQRHVADHIHAGLGQFLDRIDVPPHLGRTVRDPRGGVAGLPSVHLMTAAEIAALYPVAECHDPHANELGHVPYTPVYFVALATAITRKIHAITAPPFKVIALDCDDTLWAGICGEDGPEGVVLDPPRRELPAGVEPGYDGLIADLA